MSKTLKSPIPLKLTPQRFRPYGRIIHYPAKQVKVRNRNLFRIVLADKTAPGWRIAYLVVRDRKIYRLEKHPASFESFEPICGRSLIFVATRPDFKAIKCFYLDRPVIVNKNVWHGVVTLDRESEMKLTENAKVRCVYWKMGRKLPLLKSDLPVGDRKEMELKYGQKE